MDSPRDGPLDGLNVVVARPAAQAGDLQQALLAAGARVSLLPAIRILPCPVAAPEAVRQALAQPDSLAIFTSRNAVEQALAQLGPVSAWRAGLLAVGRATAAALADAGATVTTPAAGFNSEALLELPALQQTAVTGRPVLLVRGEGGRTLLADTLARRGAEVRPVVVYRRQASAFTPAEVRSRLGAQADAMVVSSGEIIAALAGLLQRAARSDGFDAALVVPAERLLDTARRAGFRGPLLTAASAHDADLVAALVDWARAGRPGDWS